MTYTKDNLIEIIISSNSKMTEALTGIKGALEKINDQNVLHCQAISENTKTSENLVTATSTMNRTFKWLVMVLVLAIIVLAGAEKVLKFLPAV